MYVHIKDIKRHADALAWLEKVGIKFREVVGNRHWSGRKMFITLSGKQDFLALKLVFPEAEQQPYNCTEPFDDEEVKVYCMDCNGYLWSVSGYEWKTQEEYQNYRCRKVEGKCFYESNEFKGIYAK